MTAVDIPFIRVVQMHRISRTAQHLVKQFSNRPFEKPRTTESSLLQYYFPSEVEIINHSMYNLSQDYVGRAREAVESLQNKESCERGMKKKVNACYSRQIRLYLAEIRGIKRYFSYGEDYLAVSNLRETKYAMP